MADCLQRGNSANNCDVLTKLVEWSHRDAKKTQNNLTTCEIRILLPAQIFLKNKGRKHFLGGPVVKSLPSNAGDTVWPLAQESHALRGN